uniref:MEG 2.4 isoform 1 n=1 Tax=Schistosoma mansoni TaxID=6183 RepID=D7PD69_SCHMA|nr:MEG 2.4 isoform 1 [Schistosoma mansoni]
MCLTIFYVIHLLAIFSDGAEWVITCNKTTCCDEDGNSKICCVGNDCKDVIKPRSSGADDLNLFLRKRGMANKLGEILKNLN